MSNQAPLLSLLRRIPPKWAVAILGMVLVYWIGQPILNRSLGWNLPPIAGRLGESPVSSEPDVGDAGPARPRSTSAGEPSVDKPLVATVTKPTSHTTAQASSVRDFLTEVGPDRYRSPAGLFYTRGSEEGHRLKHLAKHLEDQPTRPGSHGVFQGDLMRVLVWIDEAYQRANNGDRGAKIRQESEATIYEVTFDHAIGYVGGRDGKRRGNPSTKRLRIVVIGQNVITAFPY